jgi:hypothetical protein
MIGHSVHIVGVRRGASAIEVGRQRVVADIGEAARDVADVLDEAESLVDDDDAGVASGFARPRQIAADRVAAARKGDFLVLHPTGIGDRAREIRHHALLRLRPTEDIILAAGR